MHTQTGNKKTRQHDLFNFKLIGNVLKRTVTYGLVAVIIYLLPEYTLLEYRFRDYPDYVEAYKKAVENPGNMELWDEVDKEREKIEI